jgi:uncharacterized membrane protein
MEEVKNVEVSASDVDKIYGFLCYVLFFSFLIYKNKKESDYIQHHAKQGMLLFSTVFIANLVLLVIPILGGALAFFVNIASLVFFIIGANNALAGNVDNLPLIGQFSNIIK